LNTGKTGISSTQAWEEDWNYDTTGNWHGSSTAYLTKVNGGTTLDQNRSHNVSNEITGISTPTHQPPYPAWPTPTHDPNGNMTSIPQPLSLGDSYSLKWDAWNRLIEVKAGTTVVETYAYDGANRRVSKTTVSNTRHYFYSDQWQVLEERLDTSSSVDRRFVWGVRHVDDQILRDRDTNADGTLDERFYALHDHFSVTAIVNTSGAVQERYGYNGFGQPRFMTDNFVNSTSSKQWETLFDCYRYDSQTGLYQVRYRYLHPRLGLWLSRDSKEYAGGINLYAYVSNDPINILDH